MAWNAEQYDFSNSVANPYVKKAKKRITIRLDEDVVSYFKELSEKNGVVPTGLPRTSYHP